jgi:rhamnosyltransferase
VSRISVVIRCHNEEQHIGRLLAGISKQSVQPDQIVIVDSGSTDATLSIASRFPVEIVTIEPEDFSFGRSLNRGCAAATGDVIVIASAHVYPIYDSWLAELTAPFDRPEVALAYGRQQGDARTRYSEHQILGRWFPATSEPRQQHPFCNNANAAIRRTVWQETPYDEQLTGLEDMDWARKALATGHVVAYVAEAPVVHVHQESWSQIMNRYRREAIAHRRIYHDQAMGVFDAFRLAAANIASDYVHAAHDGALVSNVLSIPAFRVAQFWGTYQGFSQRGEVSSLLRRRFYYPHGLARGGRPSATVDRGEPIHYEEAAVTSGDVKAD